MKRADILSAVYAIALLVPAPVWASEAHGEAKSSLPQLNVALYPGLLFWLLSIFALFFLYVRFVGAPGVQKTQAKRASILGADLAAARAASDEAQKVVEEYEAALSRARHHAHETVSTILIEASKEEDERSDKLQKELTHRTHVAEENIAAARQKAMEEAPKYINDLVQDLFTRVTQVDMGAKTAKAG